METKEKLDKLANMYAQQDVIRLDKQKLIDSIMTDEIKAKIADIEDEFQPQSEGLQNNIATLEGEIKADVAGLGESVKGEHLQAVFAKGRVSWDDKGLEGLMITFPDIVKFRKVGNPSVSIRKTG
jgi:phage host-nuclease inhibitor protein Gam